MIKNHIKRRDNKLYRKFRITYDRNSKKKFRIISANRRRLNSGFKKIKCFMHATLVEEGDKSSEIWKFTVMESAHNHESLKSSVFLTIRKMYKNKKFKKKIALEKAINI
jgi:hypothetical protein